MRRAVRRYYGTARNSTVKPVVSRVALEKRVGQALCGLLALMVFAWLADQSHAWLTTTPAFRIDQLVFAGLVHADREALEQAAELLGENVFTVDLPATRARLLDTGWVAHVALRRVLPNRIHVRIRETVPTALQQGQDGRFQLLDERGCVIEDDVSQERFVLPLLQGALSAGDRLRGLALLAEIRASAPSYQLLLETVDVSAGDRVTLEATGHPRVMLLGTESMSQLVAYLRNARELREAFGGLEYVDARWRGRLFLGLSKTPSRERRGA